MSSPLTSFEEANIECAKQFLQNVVVIDNQLYFEGERPAEPAPRPVVAPTPGPSAESGASPAREASVADEESTYQDQRSLNAKVLVESFADMGITCCPYRPGSESDSEIVKRATQIARNADIVVLDWTLGETGDTRAIQILKTILEQDAQAGGRFRLVAIYTGDRRVFEIVNSVRDEVFQEPPLTGDGAAEGGDYSVTNGQATVIFVNKGSVESTLKGIRAIDADSLPDYLVSQFSTLTDGLMPNVVLASIAAIRAATHHMLGRFDNKLDPAILTHRALLRNPEDAEEFTVNLVGDEVRAILAASEVGARELGIERIRLWVKDRKSKGLKFGIDNPEEEDWRIDAPMLLLREGRGAIPKLIERYRKPDGNQYGRKAVEKGIPNIFCVSKEDAVLAHLKLSRRNTLDVESADSPFIAQDWFPMLRLGAVVHRDGDAYGRLLVCLRPLCDCIRLASSTDFSWLTLKRRNTDSVGFQFAIMLPSKEIGIYSAVDRDSSDQVPTYKFNPRKKDRIYARRIKNDFFFTSAGGKKFQWIGYLKIPFANRELEKLMQVKYRQGVDEYECLRNKAKLV